MLKDTHTFNFLQAQGGNTLIQFNNIDAIMILMTQHYNHNKDENYTENYFVMTALRSVSYIIRHL